MPTNKLELRHMRDGTPFVRVSLGRDPVTGRERRTQKSFPGMSDEEAMGAALEWYGHITGETLGEALRRYNASKTSTNTRRSYDSDARCHAAPLSDVPVRDVTTAMLNRLFTKLLSDGAKDGGPLSPSTVRRFKMYLQGAFNFLVNEGMVEHNPVKDTISIRIAPKVGVAIDDQTLKLVHRWCQERMGSEPDTQAGIRERNRAVAIWLSLVTGMRAGEVCAARRQDVSLRMGTITVSGTMAGTRRQDHTKGKRVRVVDVAESERETIRRHLSWQDGYLPKTGGTTPLVTSDGSRMTTQVLDRMFSAMRRQLGISPEYTFHSLRHTNATLLIQSGVGVKELQERLGHAAASTTVNTYAHAQHGREMLAARRIGEILGEVESW